ncbi:hypothetical protein Q5752_006944 [Cryptotrichosporon argae]
MGIFSHDVADDVLVTAAFPESNPFGLVVNGEPTALLLNLANPSANNYTLVSAAASYHDPARDWALVKNVTALKYGVPLIAGANFSAPFNLHSEFRPQELGLTVWVDVRSASGANAELHRLVAYNQTVSIVEPAASWLDPSLLFLYVLVSTALAGGAYAAYKAFFPDAKRKAASKARRVARGDAPTRDGKVKVVVPGDNKEQYPAVKPYEEEWIPEQHLRSRAGKVRKDGGATSGEELTSGGESGPEGKARRRKNKK